MYMWKAIKLIKCDIKTDVEREGTREQISVRLNIPRERTPGQIRQKLRDGGFDASTNGD